MNTVALLVLAALAASRAGAQSLPSKKAAADIVEKAESRIGLTQPGALPFHLVAKLRYKIGKISFDGTYEILWASADRYREEFRLGPLSATYLALQDKIYIQRSTAVLTYPQWRVRILTGFPGGTHGVPELHVGKLYALQSGSGSTICAAIDSPGQQHMACYSPATADIVAIKAKSYEGDLTLTLAEDSFMKVGTASFPGRALTTIGDESLEVDVERLEAVSGFGDSAFVPPDGASVRDWCAEPDVGKWRDSDLIDWIILEGARASGYYAEVGPEGNIKRLAAIYQDGSAKEISDKEALRKHSPSKPVRASQSVMRLT